MLYFTDLEKNLHVCPKCGFHNRLSSRQRLDAFLDAEGRAELASEVVPLDPLKFKDSRKYTERLSEAEKETGETDALVVMQGAVKSVPVIAAAFEFEFLGGSMGSVVGERFVRGVQACCDERAALRLLHRDGRRAHAGGAALAHADGQDDRGAAPARRPRASRSSRCSPIPRWAACRRASP